MRIYSAGMRIVSSFVTILYIFSRPLVDSKEYGEEQRYSVPSSPVLPRDRIDRSRLCHRRPYLIETEMH